MLSRVVIASFVISLVSSVPTNIFDIPTKMDEVDILMEHGKFMLANMNQSIDPCESFYEYACGNWKSDEMIPANGRNKSLTHAIQLQVDELIKDYLKNSTSNQNNTSEIKMKKFFSSCIAATTSFSDGFKEVIDTIKEPNLKNFSSNLDWIFINFHSDIGIYPLLPLQIIFNSKILKFEILISPPDAALNDFNFKNFTKDIQVEEEKHFNDMDKDFKEVQQFERNLTNFNETRNSTETLTLKEFITIHKEDKINWKRYFDVAFNGSAADTWTVNNNVKLIEKLGTVLEKTDTDLLLRYVKWRTITKFYKILKTEEHKNKSMDITCTKLAQKYFPFTATPWFINTLFDQKRRADILQISKSIIETFNSLIDQSEWLDDKTKSGARTKLNAMDILIGYTDEMKHHEGTDMIYANISITDNFWKNVINLENDTASRTKKYVDLSVIPSSSQLTQSANAYYFSDLNEAFLTIGMAQMPMYHLKFPTSLKFGGVGNLIGHEISHGFDFIRHKVDYIGRERNWWSDQSLRNFQQRYKCLEAQYNKFIYAGARTNGSRTLSENIADNIGVRLAYYAYLKELQDKSETDSKSLPNVDFTNKQIFFLMFAQSWCTGRDLSSIVNQIKTDEHSYEKFRVEGTLMNMPEFSKAFQCDLGTFMNPLKKCVIW